MEVHILRKTSPRKADAVNSTKIRGLFISLNKVVSYEFVNWSYSTNCNPLSPTNQSFDSLDLLTIVTNELPAAAEEMIDLFEVSKEGLYPTHQPRVVSWSIRP